MSLRELLILGTSSQVPTRHRNHNGYLLRWDGRGLLFDPGEGTQRQMVRSGASATDITRILITHFHGDHCLGLPGIIQRISLDRVPHRVDVHFPASGRKFFDRLQFASIYDNQARIRPLGQREEGVLHQDDSLTIEGRRLDHGVESWGYRIKEPDGVRFLPERLEAAGVRGRDIGVLQRQGEVSVDDRLVRIEDVSEPKRGQSVAVVMDTRRCAAAVELARDVDLLLIESTYLQSEAREARDHGHLTAREAAQIAVDAGARRVVLSHFSQRYPSEQPFLEEAGAIHDGVFAARDGERFAVPRS